MNSRRNLGKRKMRLIILSLITLILLPVIVSFFTFNSHTQKSDANLETIPKAIALHYAVKAAYEPVVPTPEPLYSEDEVIILAKMVFGEAGVCSTDEQRLAIWTAFQRVDADGYGDTITEVVTAPWQFVGYSPNNPVLPNIYTLCMEELKAWQSGAEPPTHDIYAPSTPYYFFDGDGKHNYYREEW